MTNGEKIKEIFPNIIKYGNILIDDTGALQKNILFDDSWWNAEYKEPTTKNDLAHNLCDSCTNIGCVFQSGIVRTECAFYMPPNIEPDNCGNYVVQDSTTKDDLGVDCISRQAVLNLFNKSDEYSWEMSLLKRNIEEMPSVTPQLSSELKKNSPKLEKDFGELGCISRQAVLDLIADDNLSMGQVVRGIHALPSVNLQEPRKGHWIYKKFDEKTGITNVYICSRCGYPLASPYKSFCSNCGSDNREVEE